MKIVIISGNAFREDYGGVAEHVKYLLPELSKYHDINIVLVTFGKINVSYEKDGIKHVILKRIKFGEIFFPFELIYDLLRMERVIRKINPDIIHLQSTIPLFSLLGIYMVKKYPTLITVHGYFLKEFNFHTGIRRIFYRLFCVPMERFALSKIPYVIVLCPQLKNMISKITESKIFIIPNGIDLNFVQQINSYQKKDYPTVFFLGYITRGKGVEDLINVIRLVNIKMNNVKLYIGGIGPDMGRLEKMVINLNLNEEVVFLGLLNEKEKFAYMKSMDVFVLPSYWESFPMVLLEAMACEKPIITTDVGGNPYLVTNDVNGYLFQPGDMNALADRLMKLLNDKNLRKNMGEESKKRVADFKWSIIARQTKEVYEKIMNFSSEEHNNMT